MIFVLLIAAIVVAGLSLLTVAGTRVIEARHPPSGRFVPVSSGRIHLLDLSAQDAQADELPVVLLHGASGNLEEMRNALADVLTRRRRVIFIDRPGLGWSERGSLREDAPPARQAALIGEALDAIGVKRAVVVAYSLGGAVGTALALNDPQRVAGLVLLAPVTHRWTGGPDWYNSIATSWLGEVFARTIVLPLGSLMLSGGAAGVFAPQALPGGYVRQSAIALLLRPRNFLANAWDLARLKDSVAAMENRYATIAAPTAIITGDADSTVSADIHSRAIHRLIPQSDLTVLPGVGHMVHFARPDLVATKVDQVARRAPVAAHQVLAK